MMEIGLKAFRLDKKGKLRFLKHTHNGSSLVPCNQWITTKKRWVHNPGRSDSKKYRSGFHFFKTKDKALKFNQLTGGKYIFLCILVKNIWAKPRSNVGSYLAESIFVSSVIPSSALKFQEYFIKYLTFL